MVFLPGDHALDKNITVANVARLTLHGESFSGNLPTIVCRGQVGLSFTSMVDFKIHSLAFTSCSKKDSAFLAIHYALLLQSTQYAELVNCSFQDNIGTALVVINSSITLAGKSGFMHNHCEFYSCPGVAITGLFSNITFNGNSTFLENIAFGHGLQSVGGAIYLENTLLNLNGISNFFDNSATYGGAIYAVQNTLLTFNGANNFISNSADYGGAIYSGEKTILSFTGANSFISNSARQNGGAIYTENSFSKIHHFTNNSADRSGGTIYTLENPMLSFISKFTNNLAVCGGAFHALRNNILSFSGTNIFNSNLADSSGGVIYATENTVFSFNGTNSFNSNSALYSGGAIFAFGTICFSGISNFLNNSVHSIGGAISTISNVGLSFDGISNFINNSAYEGGAIFTLSNVVLSFTNGTHRFVNNVALMGGAIRTSDNNTLIFDGTIYFTNNSGTYAPLFLANSHGGGVYMGRKSTFSILSNTTVYWENNHANFGGAIYVQDASPVSYCEPYIQIEECFFQLPGQNLSSIDVQLVFKNNSADAAGSVLYGGAIDNCKLTDLDTYNSGEVFDMIVHIEDDTSYNKTSQVSSDPLYVCPCENNHPVCNRTVWFKNVYPGETVQVSAVAFGQRNGTLPSSVRSIVHLGTATVNNTMGNLTLGPADLPHSQYVQQANNTCTKLQYTVFSLSQYVGIKLHAEGTLCSIRKYELLSSILLNLSQICPPGFKLVESAKSCICEPRLAKYASQCNITNGVGQITRDSRQHFWVGYDSHKLILHPHCPFDYCVNDTVVFPLSNPDLQCAYNRSGFLCGRCKEGYSLMLGSHQCRKCTNSYIVLLIPFAVMGVALVFFLLVCKLTVATGTLSGLVLYANIIGPNLTTFLPLESTNVLSIFIAWLNLDFGIEACFYNELNTYSKTWLQFVFPVYIWMLVGLSILVSNCSHRFANLLGNNPVSVLATLILLSYTKILRTLITVVYVTYLEYPTYNRMVWLYDANVDYLSGKHIPLFLVAVLVFLFLFLPYTLLLLFGQWLQAMSHLRLFSWVNSSRLKPFMDAYHAPYKAKHRYWPGLLLVLRFFLLLVFAFQFNPQQDRVSINLLAVLVGMGILVVWAWISGGVYRNWYLDALEGSFVLNLIILVGATCYVKLAGGNQLAVGYTSVSIAFTTFIGILMFQLANVTNITQYLKRKCAAVVIRNEDQAAAETEPQDNDSLPDRLINPGEYEPPFHTPQRNATTESIKGEEQRRLLPVYTYGSIN